MIIAAAAGALSADRSPQIDASQYWFALTIRMGTSSGQTSVSKFTEEQCKLAKDYVISQSLFNSAVCTPVPFDQPGQEHTHPEVQ